MLDRTFNAVFDGLNEQYKLSSRRASSTPSRTCGTAACLRLGTPRRWHCSASRPPSCAPASTDADEGRKKLEARIESVANHADTEDIGTEDEAAG